MIFFSSNWREAPPPRIYKFITRRCPGCNMLPPRYFEVATNALCAHIYCTRCGEGFLVAPKLEIAASIGVHPRHPRAKEQAQCHHPSTTSKQSTEPQRKSPDTPSVTLIDPCVPRRPRSPVPKSLDPYAPPAVRQLQSPMSPLPSATSATAPEQSSPPLVVNGATPAQDADLSSHPLSVLCVAAAELSMLTDDPLPALNVPADSRNPPDVV